MIAAGDDPVTSAPRRPAGRHRRLVELHVEQGRDSPHGCHLGVAEGSGRTAGGGSSSRVAPITPGRLGSPPPRPDAALCGHGTGRPPSRRGQRAVATFGKVIVERNGTMPFLRRFRPGWTPAPRTERRCGHGHDGPFGLRRLSRGTRGRAERAPGVVHPPRAFRRGAAEPDRRHPRRGGLQRPDPAHRRRPTTPGSSPPASRPPCCSSATRPASRTRPPSTPTWPTPDAGVAPWPPSWKTSLARHDPALPGRRRPSAARPSRPVVSRSVPPADASSPTWPGSPAAASNATSSSKPTTTALPVSPPLAPPPHPPHQPHLPLSTSTA